MSRIGLGLGLGISRAQSQGVPWSPLSIGCEVWLEASPLDALMVERTGASATTAAALDGVVGSRRNRGLAGGWVTSPSNSARPYWRTDGAHYWLEYDGTDDCHTPFPLSGYASIFMGVRRTNNIAGITGAAATPSSGGGAMILLTTDASYWGTYGTGMIYANSVLGLGADAVVGMNGTSSGEFRLNGATNGTYSSTAGQSSGHIGGLQSPKQSAAMREYCTVARSTPFSPGEMAKLEKYIASRAGVSL